MMERESSKTSGDETEEKFGCGNKLDDFGLDPHVVEHLNMVLKTHNMRVFNLDDRAIGALKELPVEDAVIVLNQFKESNLENVSNNSAYLCGLMKSFRQSRAAKIGKRMSSQMTSGPSEEKIQAILSCKGYSLDVTPGQRKYGGPPPGWQGPPPGQDCEVFCGKLPKNLLEDELIPMFEECGTIWELRLMMDPMMGLNKGFAFIKFTTRVEALNAVNQLHCKEITPGHKLKVNISVSNTRLFVGNIPKCKTKEQVANKFERISPGILNVILYSSPDDRNKNRGFCFLEYESYKAACVAKRRLGVRTVKVWNCGIVVDWADPLEEPDDDIMATVKILYCKNLSSVITEEILRNTFGRFGKIERVKKIKNFAFVHYETREQAIDAMKALDQKELFDTKLEISLAKPPQDKKKREDLLRRREQRMMQAMAESIMPASSYSSQYVYGNGRFGSGSGWDHCGGEWRREPAVPGGMDYGWSCGDSYDGGNVFGTGVPDLGHRGGRGRVRRSTKM